jgi:hypothetical protein
MAGEPFNRDAQTGEEFDGSARLALSSAPPFTRIALCEMPQKAVALERDLRARYPTGASGSTSADHLAPGTAPGIFEAFESAS